MQLQDLGDALIYVGALAAALAAIGIVLRWAVVRPVQRYIQREILGPLTRIERRLDQHIRDTGAHVADHQP